MAQLEEIVDRLESGGETLDGSIKLFEMGARLSALLDRKLSEAEQKITVLTAPDAQDDSPKQPEHE